MALPFDIEADLEDFLETVLDGGDISDFPALEQFELMMQHVQADLEDLDTRLSVLE